MSEWTDIGQQLRETREKKGLDLRDVAHSTRIPLTTLKALEDSDYSVFPSPTYARSFLAQYSEFLDVDAHDWIDAFETGDVLSSINDHGYLQDDHDHIGDAAPRTPSTPSKRSSSSRSREEKSSGGGTSILQTLTVFFVTAALIAGGIYAYIKYEPMLSGSAQDEATTEKESTQPEQTADTSNGQATATTPDQPTPSSPPTASEKPETPPPAATTPEKTEPEVAATPKPPKPTVPKPRTGPPPKAMVIEEDE